MCSRYTYLSQGCRVYRYYWKLLVYLQRRIRWRWEVVYRYHKKAFHALPQRKPDSKFNLFYHALSLFCFLDINECSLSNACHPNSNCSNTLGSFICECNPGYSGDGKTCAGKQYSSAYHHDMCMSTNTCRKVYDKIVYFIDIDECVNGTSDCNQNAICRNTNGGYVCECKMGYVGNGKTCEGTCTIK